MLHEEEDGRIDWSQPAQAIHNRIRGVQPWPGAYTERNGKTLKIHRATVVESIHSEARPGEVGTAEGDRLVVAAETEGLRFWRCSSRERRRWMFVRFSWDVRSGWGMS